MNIFTAAYLKKFVGSQFKLKVYVNQEYLDLDKDSFDSNVKGVGYTIKGAPKKFMYDDITQIKIGSHTVTLDMINSKNDNELDEGNIVTVIHPMSSALGDTGIVESMIGDTCTYVCTSYGSNYFNRRYAINKSSVILIK